MVNTKRYKAITQGAAWLLANLEINSPYGNEALKLLRPAGQTDIEALQQGFTELELLRSHIQQHPEFSTEMIALFKHLRHIGGTLRNLEQKQVLDEVELLEIKYFCILSENIAGLFLNSQLQLPSIAFANSTAIINLLNPDQTIVSSFHVHGAYSENLRQVRDNKRLVEAQILQEKDPDRREQLRNQRAEIVFAEKEEEFEVRTRLSQQLHQWLPTLQRNSKAIANLELLSGKALAALRWPSCLPTISTRDACAFMKITNAISPEMVEILRGQGKLFTPVSIELQPGVTMLTGANMGGKTVALQTIAMNTELVTLGFFPFAEKWQMPLPNFICVSSGDGQDRYSGLSSFGAELISFNKVAAESRRHQGLIIFDEFARSTNPFEGRRFVQALCDFLQLSGSHGIVATHYDGIILKDASHYQVVGLKSELRNHPGSGCSSEDILQNLCTNMDYRLMKIDGPYEVPKDALHIATLLESDAEFLRILKKYYD